MSPARPAQGSALPPGRPAAHAKGAALKRRAWLLWAALPAALAQADVDANTATRAQLESLPGLGPALVQRLLAARPFAGWSDLMKRVPGIGRAMARKLSASGLRVGGQPYGG
jgi:competence protein ComEA